MQFLITLSRGTKMNKLIITIAMVALSQVAMGKEKNTLEKAQEVAQQMRDAADTEYAKGVAKRAELRQWSDAAEAVNRIRARYNQHEGIRHKAQVEYDRFKSAYAWCWGVGACLDHKRAARHWQGFRDRTEPYVAIAESHIKTSGTTIDTEVDRTTRHLEWAKMEKRWADSMERIVREEYRTGNYIDEAVRTVNTANAEVIWAEESVRTARKAINSLLDGALDKVRQAKYDKADDYLRQQRVIHEAEQAEIERAASEAEQAITDKENGFLQVIKLLLYITRQGG
jgi:hypothetical protein